MPSTRTLIAMLVAIASGYSMIRHARKMPHDGVALEDGGGWTALILTEFMIAMGGLGVAIY